MKYHAFISYSHADKTWGDLLHKALETYQVPKTLVGRITTRAALDAPADGSASFETVPTRAYPIFRDREELPTATDLGAILHAALRESRYLIVICSPRSAKSQWVNEEILFYKRLGRENRILALIVDGEPNAADGKPGFATSDECFPEALKFKLGPDGQLSAERTEPIAADARVGKDGKQNALLKLLAGVLGVAYDDLRQRDAARQRRRRQILAVALGLALAGAWFVSSRFAAEQREKSFQIAVAELGHARQLLTDKQPDLAAITALHAIESAEMLGRELEPAWWVLRRALDANRMAYRWNASSDTINELAFDASGRRLLTFSQGPNTARLWSIPDGKPVATLNSEKRIDFATLTTDGEKAVTLHSWHIDPQSYNDTESDGLDLVWWNTTTGARERAITLRSASFFNPRTKSTTPPAWIVADQYTGDTRVYRLIRLSDGWADQTLPVPTKPNWGSGPVFVEHCGVVLLVDPGTGVSLFTLGSDGAARGRLEGVEPAEKLRLTGLVPSVDRTAFSALVWDGDKPLASGVWSATDGRRLTGTKLDAAAVSSRAWIGAAGATGITGNRDELSAPLAPALGRHVVPSLAYEVAGFIWHDASEKKPPVTAVLGQFGDVKVIRPDDDWSLTLPEKSECIALSPDGSWIASGDNYGNVTLWLTDSPFSLERSLPEGATMVNDTGKSLLGGDGTAWFQPAADRLMRWDITARKVKTEISGLVPQPGTWLKFEINTDANWLVATPSLPIMQPVPSGWKSSFYDLTSGRLLGQRPAAPFVLASRGRRALGPGVNGWSITGVVGETLTSVDLLPSAKVDQEWATAAAFSPDGMQVFVARGDGKIEVFNCATGESLRMITFADNQKTSINHMSVDPSGHWALLATYAKWWRVDLIAGRAEEVFTQEDHPDTRWTFIDDGKVLVGSVNSFVKWWTFPELKPIAQTKVESTSTTVATAPGGKELFIKTDWGDTLTVVDRLTGAERLRMSGVIALDPSLSHAAIKFSVDGRDSLRIVRLSDGEILAEHFDLSPSAASFSADGSRVLLQCHDKLLSFVLPYDTEVLRRQAALLRPPAATSAKP